MCDICISLTLSGSSRLHPAADTASPVPADTGAGRAQSDSRAVKKTLPIPAWLNKKAEDAGNKLHFYSIISHSYGIIRPRLQEVIMPCIVPIRDLKNTAEISELCHTEKEPVFITKNGYGDMVIMSMETYERSGFMQDVYGKIEEAEDDIQSNRLVDAKSAVQNIKEKYEL
jgi:PHD/YefM family antitoxin component YafN of YafNO toxin-antitoxin module